MTQHSRPHPSIIKTKNERGLSPFIKKVSEKIERDSVHLFTNTASQRQEVARLRSKNIDYYLSKCRELLGGTNFKLLWAFKDYLRSEDQSPWSVYTATYRVTQFALFLKGFGRDLANPTPQLVRLFLSTKGSRENIRRYGATLKKFYKFMIECYGEEYEKIYRPFKVPSFKIDDYPLCLVSKKSCY